MALATDKLTDQIPYFDGTFRRRFTSGGLVVLPLLIFAAYESGFTVSELGLKVEDIVASPVVALGFLILIYAVGNVVEMVGEVFVARIAGNLVWTFLAPLNWFSDKPRWLRYSLRTLAWYPGFAFLFYWYFLKGLIGISDYRWQSLAKSLEPDAQAEFEKLPAIVRRSLEEPFGNHADIAFKYFRLSTPRSERDWILRLEARNKDILATIAALFILFVFFLILVPAPSETIETRALTTPTLNIVVSMQVLALVVGALFLGYFLILRKSIIEMLEIWSVRPDTAPDSEEFPTG